MADIVWGIHGGRFGDADSLFRKKGVIALGWEAMPDLSTIAPDRDAFKAAVTAAYPDKTSAQVANNAGQLYRFVHELETGDLVVYPSKASRRILVGRVTGPYVYDTSTLPAYAHRRSVQWLKEDFPRTRFSQGALQESGSAMSFFQIRNFADEFIAAARGEQPAIESLDEEEATVSLVAEEIETTTRDFVLRRLARELKGHPFAALVGDLLSAIGYYTTVSPPGPDRGIDIVASRDELALEPPVIKVQVKSTEGNIGGPDVSQLLGVLAPGEFGLFVTLGSFTREAKAIAAAQSHIRLIDGDELVRLVLAHYDSLDAKYKGVIPLKRIFIPEGVGATE